MRLYASVRKLPESRKPFCVCCSMPITRRAFIAATGQSMCAHVAKVCSAICSGPKFSVGDVAVPCVSSKKCSIANGWCIWTTDIPPISAIPDYDAWIPRAPKKEAASATPPDNGFNDFWEQYHEITRKDKVNPAKARKSWNKLSANERTAAVENIENYYGHLNSTLFCLQAVNYLSNKAFLNEYEY